MPRRFLVTGGCGFIGSHLVEHFIQQGHLVTVVDDLSSGYKSNLANVGPLQALIEARVEDVDFSQLGRFDGVFHLAAQASVPLSIKQLFFSSSTNVLSTLRVIDYCATARVPLVYASSSAVYGNLPIGDEGGTVELLSPYSADKYMSELYCDVAYKLYGLRSYGLRFFNVYGPRQDSANPYSGVISIFADKILKNEPITIYGGYQTRDFVFVKDVVRGICEGYQYLLNNAVATYSNLLTGSSISIDELANKLIFLTGNNVKKVYKDLPPGDPEKSLGKVDKMLAQLRVREFVKLDDGLRQVLTWMETLHE
jgi:UDP-glucose 4-epimerase